MYEFERVIPRKRPTGEAIASIGGHNKRILTLNKRAYEILGTPAKVEMYFDPKRRVIGIRPAKNDDPYAYIPQTKGRSGLCAINIGALVGLYELNVGEAETQRYSVGLHEGTLVIDTTKPLTPPTFLRRKVEETAG